MRRKLLASTIASLALTYSPICLAEVNDDATKAAQSLVKSYEEAYKQHDAKAISMLFVPEGVFLPPNGSPVVQGRAAIEQSWTDLFKNVGGEQTISLKYVTPVGKDGILAVSEWKIVGDAGKTMSGRSAITLVRTPDGWRYVSIAPQTQPPPSGSQK